MPHYLDQTIFTGTATRVVDSEGRALLNGECSRTLLQTVTIAVKQVFSGHLPQTLTFHAGDINGAYFTQKVTYLIIGDQKPDGTFVANSLVTKPVAEAEDDLAFLRSIPKRAPTAELFGGAFTTYPYPHDNVIPIADRRTEGLRLSVKGPAQIETTTGPDGQFKLTGLTPGHYTVQLETDTPTVTGRTQTVDVAPRGCAEINFYIVKPFPTKKSEKQH